MKDEGSEKPLGVDVSPYLMQLPRTFEAALKESEAQKPQAVAAKTERTPNA